MESVISKVENLGNPFLDDLHALDLFVNTVQKTVKNLQSPGEQ